MKFLNRIKSARPLGEHRLKLVFGDGYVSEIDLVRALHGPVFEPLEDPDYFAQVRVEDHTIRWSNGADFDPDVLRYWCEAGGVQSRERTHAWFSNVPAVKSA